eukprot:scaffold24718_cov56-Phaeocystis_antarctica.AAC.3
MEEVGEPLAPLVEEGPQLGQHLGECQRGIVHAGEARAALLVHGHADLLPHELAGGDLLLLGLHEPMPQQVLQLGGVDRAGSVGVDGLEDRISHFLLGAQAQLADGLSPLLESDEAVVVHGQAHTRDVRQQQLSQRGQRLVFDSMAAHLRRYAPHDVLLLESQRGNRRSFIGEL